MAHFLAYAVYPSAVLYVMRVLRMGRIVNTTCKLDVLQLKCRSCFIHYYDQQAREFLKSILRPDSCLHCLFFLLRAIKVSQTPSSPKIPSPGLQYKKIPITHKFRSPALSDCFSIFLCARVYLLFCVTWFGPRTAEKVSNKLLLIYLVYHRYATIDMASWTLI